MSNPHDLRTALQSEVTLESALVSQRLLLVHFLAEPARRPKREIRNNLLHFCFIIYKV